jgi:cell wall-associated NlpC family hydrolase
MVPVRKEPSDKSEITSQLLFGESVEIIDKQESWRHVKMLHDNYTGWIDKKQVSEIDEDEMLKIRSATTMVSSDLVQLAIWNKNQICPVVIGSTLPSFHDHKFSIGKTDYAFEGNIIELKSPDITRLLEHAYMYLNAPYLWGGRSPFGIDCSGFTQMVYKLCGKSIHRDAYH